MISKNEFFKRVKDIKSFQSVRGKGYVDLNINGHVLSFKRVSSGQIWEMNLNVVYEIYTREDFISTIVIKKYLNNRTYSPSLGLLIATGLYSTDRKRIND